jgi:hypothetical protein
MIESATTGAAPSPAPASDQFETRAAGALAAVVRSGARILEDEPWRIARIVRGADAMTIAELRAHVERRRRAGLPADHNLAIALAQLSLALEAPTFDEIWVAWLSSHRGE